MNKLLISIVLLAAVIVAPISAIAQVSVSIGIPLPPPIVFQAPPQVIVLPDAPDVYVVPDVDIDLFFYNGWWWRFWDGYWYRSRYYDRDWVYFDHVPRFYFDVDPDWRGFYRGHEWHGHPWDYRRIPNGQLQRNWSTWHSNGYWQRQRTWGVQNYHPRPAQEQQALRQQRQQQYRQRPEVQRHQQVGAQPQRRQAPQERQLERQGPPREQRQPQVERRQIRGEERQGPQFRPEERQGGQFRGEERQGGGEHGRPEGRPERGEGGRR